MRAVRSVLTHYRAWNVYCTSGQSDIQPVAMFRASMTSRHHSSKSSSTHILVSMTVSQRIGCHAHHPMSDSDPEEFDTAILPDNVRMAVEADTFWCLSRLLDGIQDNYIAGQPGIHRSVKRMAELVARIDCTSLPTDD